MHDIIFRYCPTLHFISTTLLSRMSLYSMARGPQWGLTRLHAFAANVHYGRQYNQLVKVFCAAVACGYLLFINLFTEAENIHTDNILQ